MNRTKEELEKEINESRSKEELFRIILSNVSSGVALIDETGQFLLYNAEFLRLFGLSTESTIRNVNDQKWSDWQVFNENMEILHVDDHPVRKAAISGKPVRNQLVYVQLPSGGIPVWMLISAEPILKANGDIDKVICTYQNVTEHRLTDISLRKSEDRLRLALEAAHYGTWDLDLVTGNVIRSLRHDQIFGYFELQPEWTLETKLKHVLPEDRSIFIEANENAVTTGELFSELRVRWPDGNIHWISLRGKTHYDSKGKAIRIIGIVSDITERKEVENALKENEKHLYELNATKDKFFSIIAHDLRSPFTSIIGFSDLLIDKIQSKDYSGLEEYSRMIQRSSWQAMDLLKNLFEWSRLHTGSIEYKPVEFDIISAIDDEKKLLNDSAWQKSITISEELPSTLKIVADKYMIGTVLRNLISNAIKFTNPGGLVTISAEKTGNDLIVSVSDNGVGINKEEIKKLFRMDVSYTLNGTNGEAGSGLGLLLCKDFISKHHGSISAESEVGKGSKFSFTIPVQLIIQPT